VWMLLVRGKIVFNIVVKNECKSEVFSKTAIKNIRMAAITYTPGSVRSY
jgi:hypothetical protein